MRLDSDQRFGVAADRETVWGALEAVERYPTWWPWLEDFDGSELAPGVRWRCLIRSPLRIALRVTILLDEVEPGHAVRASLTEDLVGTATITVSEAASGTAIRLTSALTPESRLLATIGVLAPPVARRAHDHLLHVAATQFTHAIDHA